MRESGSSYRSSIQVPPLTGPLLAVGVLLAVLPPVPPQALSSKTSSDKNDTQSMSILDWGLLCIMSSSENKLKLRIRLTIRRVNHKQEYQSPFLCSYRGLASGNHTPSMRWSCANVTYTTPFLSNISHMFLMVLVFPRRAGARHRPTFLATHNTPTKKEGTPTYPR